MSEKPWRLFIGAYPPREVVRNLENAITRWKEDLQFSTIKWVSPDKIHLTLCFIGDVECAAVPELAKEMSAAAGETNSFSLAVKKLGVFPNLKRPRVFWAGIDGDFQSLLSLQSRVAGACRACLQKADEQHFSAHLTLARLKDANPSIISRLQEVIGCGSELSFGKWKFDEMQLIRSELGGKGSSYTPLASFALAKVT